MTSIFLSLPDAFLQQVAVDSNNIFDFACVSKQTQSITNKIFNAIANGFKKDFLELLREFQFEQLPPITLASYSSLQAFKNLYDREKMAQTEGVKRINVAGQDFTSIPTALLTLKEVETLNLSNNPIQHIPECFNQLVKISQLYLSHTQVSHLPLQGLQNLQELRASSCQIKVFPEEILNLPIETLVLANNQIEILPEGIDRITTLKTLDLSQNCIKCLPNNLGNLSALTSLNLSENQIEMLPTSISRLRNLNWASLEGNPLGQPLESGDRLMEYLASYSSFIGISLHWSVDSVKEELKSALLERVRSFSQFKMLDYRSLYVILSKTINYPDFYQEDSAPWFEITRVSLLYASPSEE